jgi:hypothetical protein
MDLNAGAQSRTRAAAPRLPVAARDHPRRTRCPRRRQARHSRRCRNVVFAVLHHDALLEVLEAAGFKEEGRVFRLCY